MKRDLITAILWDLESSSRLPVPITRIKKRGMSMHPEIND
jgi:hypothetical protein